MSDGLELKHIKTQKVFFFSLLYYSSYITKLPTCINDNLIMFSNNEMTPA